MHIANKHEFYINLLYQTATYQNTKTDEGGGGESFQTMSPHDQDHFSPSLPLFTLVQLMNISHKRIRKLLRHHAEFTL